MVETGSLHFRERERKRERERERERERDIEIESGLCLSPTIPFPIGLNLVLLSSFVA